MLFSGTADIRETPIGMAVGAASEDFKLWGIAVDVSLQQKMEDLAEMWKRDRRGVEGYVDGLMEDPAFRAAAAKWLQGMMDLERQERRRKFSDQYLSFGGSHVRAGYD